MNFAFKTRNCVSQPRNFALKMMKMMNVENDENDENDEFCRTICCLFSYGWRN